MDIKEANEFLDVNAISLTLFNKSEHYGFNSFADRAPVFYGSVSTEYGDIDFYCTERKNFFSNKKWFSGYVKLPENHPWLKLTNITGDLDPRKIEAKAEENEKIFGNLSYISFLTFANNRWIGFDADNDFADQLQLDAQMFLYYVLIWVKLVLDAAETDNN